MQRQPSAMAAGPPSLATAGRKSRTPPPSCTWSMHYNQKVHVIVFKRTFPRKQSWREAKDRETGCELNIYCVSACGRVVAGARRGLPHSPEL